MISVTQIVPEITNAALGQFDPFGRSSGAPRRCLGDPDLLEQKKGGAGEVLHVLNLQSIDIRNHLPVLVLVQQADLLFIQSRLTHRERD